MVGGAAEILILSGPIYMQIDFGALIKLSSLAF